ncbi:MAG: hypothetical protein Q9209_005503 [Squamulea sp. 1 TL-2023]
MPGDKYDITARLPFHMTTHSPIGVVFSNYDHVWVVPNFVINQILYRASQAVEAAIAGNPGLINRPLTEETSWKHPTEDVTFFIEPEVPFITYGDLGPLFRLLGSWARVYMTETCSFEIWELPRTTLQKRLGTGHFLMT